jgi:hypothetical protein
MRGAEKQAHVLPFLKLGAIIVVLGAVALYLVLVVLNLVTMPHQSRFRVCVRVIDQDEKPVSDCVLLLATEYVPINPLSNKRYASRLMTTDKNGMFCYDSQRKGYRVHIDPMRDDPRNRNVRFALNYSEFAVLAVKAGEGRITEVDEAHPRVVKVIRHGNPVSLIKQEIYVDLKVCKEPYATIDVLAGKVVVGGEIPGSLKVYLHCLDNIKGKADIGRLKSMEIMAGADGGVQRVKDSFLVLAPPAGYKRSCEITAEELHGGTGKPHVYFSLFDGQVYGMLESSPLGIDDDTVGLMVRYSANPRGSRDLFSDYGMTIPVPVTLPYHDPKAE